MSDNLSPREAMFLLYLAMSVQHRKQGVVIVIPNERDRRSAQGLVEKFESEANGKTVEIVLANSVPKSINMGSLHKGKYALLYDRFTG